MCLLTKQGNLLGAALDLARKLAGEVAVDK